MVYQSTRTGIVGMLPSPTIGNGAGISSAGHRRLCSSPNEVNKLDAREFGSGRRVYAFIAYSGLLSYHADLKPHWSTYRQTPSQYIP